MEKFDFIDSKFRLALLAAKRAKQLVNGSRKRVDSFAENPLTVAIEEVYAGKVRYKILSEAEMERLQMNYYSVPPMEAEEQDDLLFGEPGMGSDPDSESDSDELELDDRDEDDDTEDEDEDADEDD